jgi:dTMP kinase
VVPRGRLITIEGVEGAGKSTQLAGLHAWLGASGLAVVITAEPDGTPVGLRIRRLLGEASPLDPLTECFLFAAARAEHTRRIIAPALEAGRVVLSDRFSDSTVAYQGHGRGVPLETIAAINRVATDEIVPDLTIVLDLDVAEGLRRIRGRGGSAAGAGIEDPFERLGVEFHERVRKGYWAIRDREPVRVHLVDADRPPERVARDVRRLVRERLGLGVPDPDPIPAGGSR